MVAWLAGKGGQADWQGVNTELSGLAAVVAANVKHPAAFRPQARVCQDATMGFPCSNYSPGRIKTGKTEWP